MRLRWSVDPARRLVTFISDGSPSVAEFRTAFDSVLAHPDYQPGFNFLHDRRRNPQPPSPEVVREAIQMMRELSERLGGARWAIVLPANVATLRPTIEAIDMSVEALGIEMRPFISVEDAERWLGVAASPGKPTREE